MSRNTQTSEENYLDGGGFATEETIGYKFQYTFSGHRDYADPAQNYIFGRELLTGDALNTTFRVVRPNGEELNGEASIMLGDGGGASNEKESLEVVITFRRQPEKLLPTEKVI